MSLCGAASMPLAETGSSVLSCRMSLCGTVNMPLTETGSSMLSCRMSLCGTVNMPLTKLKRKGPACNWEGRRLVYRMSLSSQSIEQADTFVPVALVVASCPAVRVC